MTNLKESQFDINSIGDVPDDSNVSLYIDYTGKRLILSTRVETWEGDEIPFSSKEAFRKFCNWLTSTKLDDEIPEKECHDKS